MSGNRKQYDREFKLEAVKLIVDQGRSVNDVSKSLGVLSAWRRKYLADGIQAFPGQGKMKAGDDEVRRLKAELSRVRQGRDILKKAMGYFVKDRR